MTALRSTCRSPWPPVSTGPQELADDTGRRWLTPGVGGIGGRQPAGRPGPRGPDRVAAEPAHLDPGRTSRRPRAHRRGRRRAGRGGPAAGRRPGRRSRPTPEGRGGWLHRHRGAVGADRRGHRHVAGRPCSGPAPGPPGACASRPATPCSPTWSRRAPTAGPMGSSARWTTWAPSAGRCWPSAWSPWSACGAAILLSSSPGCSPPPRSCTPSATSNARPAARAADPAAHPTRPARPSWAGSWPPWPPSRSAMWPRPCSSCAPPNCSPPITGSRPPPARPAALHRLQPGRHPGQRPSRPLTDHRGPRLVLAAGIGLFLVAYLGFAVTGANLVLLAGGFVAAGAAIGSVETAEHAAITVAAPAQLRGSAFGLLAAIQSFGNLAASAIARLLWTAASPAIAFAYLAGWMALSLIALATARMAATRP